MSTAIAAIASRVRELDTLLGQMGRLSWSGAESVASATALVSPWPSKDPAGAGRRVGAVVTTVPFATIIRNVASDVAGEGGSGVVVKPVVGGRITQRFSRPAADGLRGHEGLDIAAPLGTPVRALAAGTVRFAGVALDGAVVVRIEHADGTETLYGHLQPGLGVRAGDRVAAGTTIGRIGLTGRTTGPHLHLEVRAGGRPIDPEPILESGRLPGSLRALGAEQLGRIALRRFDAIAERIPYAAEIRTAAVDAGIDPLLLAALVRTESGFRTDAVSRAGAMGLTQLMPATARALGVDDPVDPAANLDGGARYLAGNLRMFGRVDLALAAYHAGKAAVRRAGGIPDSPVTQAYVARVLETWAGYLAAAEEQDR